MLCEEERKINSSGWINIDLFETSKHDIVYSHYTLMFIINYEYFISSTVIDKPKNNVVTLMIPPTRQEP